MAKKISSIKMESRARMQIGVDGRTRVRMNVERKIGIVFGMEQFFYRNVTTKIASLAQIGLRIGTSTLHALETIFTTKVRNADPLIVRDMDAQTMRSLSITEA